ncbi:MAG: zinc-ribbon domain-containing protein, partial [Streptosporangiaceae bacterium]
MVCPTCGAPVTGGHRFCGQCGAALGQNCAACGFANEATARFCVACGAAVGQASPAGAGAGPAAPPPPRGDGREVPGASVELRLVSILFADLVGFTTLAEARDAEE